MLAMLIIHRIYEDNAFALSETHPYASHESTSPHWLDNLPWRGEFWHHGLMPFPRRRPTGREETAQGWEGWDVDARHTRREPD
jgi:hypothetical protein